MTDRSGIHVLALDDEPFILKLVGHMLGRMGFTQTVTFQRGAEALAHIDAAAHTPDLILCDLNMPEMDGIEFLRKLVDRGFEGSLIFVSGEDSRALQASEQLARAHGITVLGALHKPMTPQALQGLVQNWAPRPRGPARSGGRTVYDAERLRKAIADGELTAYYQPQVDVRTGHVHGVEALVRWRHPVDGMVFPDQFIGVAEEHDLIDDLTRAVLVAALRQARIWQDAGLELRVSVNVSMDNLAKLDFADYVTSALASAGVSPKLLIMEVTESRLMHDLRAPLEVLTRLRLRRVGLSIDDFGTGHSSLTQLRNMPFDELKIDQSFVHGATHNTTLRAIHEASVGLARQLDLLVVAEGVEDRADWDLLLATDCDLAQGYFVARPMPGEDIVPWIAKWEERYRSGLR